MPPNLFGDRLVLRGRPAWHEFGTVFDADLKLTATQAAEQAGLMYDIVKAPLYAHVYGGLADDVIEIEGKYGLMRLETFDDPNVRYLGICSENYSYLQNREIAELLDPISNIYPIESVGALGNGETAVFCFDAGEAKIAKELYHLYYLFTDTRDGGTKAKMAFTPVRFECQNTLVLGLKQAVITMPIGHTSTHRSMATWQLKMVEDMAKSQELSIEALERLAKYAVTAEQVEEILALTYPKPRVPVKAEMLELVKEDAEEGLEAAMALYNEAERAGSVYEFYVHRADRFRDLTRELYEVFNADKTHKKLAGTAYALFQAVCENADYRQGTDTVGQSTLFGVRAREKTKAWAAIERVVVNG